MNLSPQHASYSAYSARERIKKSPRWDNDEGVAATVGTIMALLVFITFFGIFTNQFLPVWMGDNESEHMSQAIEQFSNLKSSVDISIANTANSVIAPTPVFVPITLSSGGIPVFASPTAGILSFMPMGYGVRPMFNVTYNYISTTGGTAHPYQLNAQNDGMSGGYLELYCPNRYYVEQKLVYENGAIILNQTDGEVVLAGPQMLVKNLGTTAQPNRVMLLTQITMLGLNVTIGGTGSKGVNADLDFAETKALENTTGSTVTIDIVSKHGWAWYNYFYGMLNDHANMYLGNGFNMTLPELHKNIYNSAESYYTFTLTIDNIKVLDHTKATVTVSIGELGV